MQTFLRWSAYGLRKSAMSEANMKTFKQKKDELAELEDKLGHSNMAVFTAYAKVGEKGLSVGKMRELKKSLSSVGAKYFVAKKSLIDKAIKDCKIPDVDVFKFDGSLGMAFGTGDEALTAKTLSVFARGNTSLKLYGAIMGQNFTPTPLSGVSGHERTITPVRVWGFINASRFSELAKLPSREVMIARTLGMLQYPITGLITTLQGNIHKFLLTLKAIEQNKS